MDDAEFDRALIAAAFELIAQKSWRGFNIAAAARLADLPLDRARLRFPVRVSVLYRLGRMADAAALSGVRSEAPVRDNLFDMLMRRIDTLQPHRAGLLALLRALPTEPALVLLLAAADRRSMAWLLDAVGVPTGFPLGQLRAKGLHAVWLWTLRAWQRDGSTDLAATMAALDTALGRAERAAELLPGGVRHATPPAEEMPPEAPPEPA